MAFAPAFEVSRPRLREVSHWIRDELDPVVAREGPGVLRADDVLTLHDIFQGLRKSSDISALDLRATGIHKAIMDISGKATRWPSRLIDDCDMIIELWTSRFGRLKDLHPFLYGRGGRLEGIASMEETSKTALLKRWQAACPDKISPKVSHKYGSLGFQPGSWWINPLFACHAGIIDVDTVEGGICHDKHAAYAILIKDTGELEAWSGSAFTYRCGEGDRGKYRLTAGTSRARESIRVLRSHHTNSIWAPKAGVRYEGLYKVTGWSIYQPKAGGPGQKGSLANIVYDIRLERCDRVPMIEVSKFPTASELDVYMEYKRLRNLYHMRHRELGESPTVQETFLAPVKVAPPIAPAIQGSPQTSLSATGSKGGTQSVPPVATERYPSPKTFVTKEVVILEPTPSPEEEPSPSSTRAIPRYTNTGPMNHNETRMRDMYRAHTPEPQTPDSDTSGQTIKNIAPWVDYGLPRASTSIPNNPSVVAKRPTAFIVQDDPPRTRPFHPANDLGSWNPFRKKSGDKQFLHLQPSFSGKEGRKSIFMRSRNPTAKLFDGTEEKRDQEVDYFNFKQQRAASVSPTPTPPVVTGHARSSSLGITPQLVSPVPRRPYSPISPPLLRRRNAAVFPIDFFTPTHQRDTEPEGGNFAANEDPLLRSLSASLNEFLVKVRESSARLATPTPLSLDGGRLSRNSTSAEQERRESAAGRESGDEQWGFRELEVKVAFRDPFGERKRSERRGSVIEDVAPDAVV